MNRELLVDTVKKLKSEETQLIHLAESGEKRCLISIVDNALYALFLFESKTRDEALEARSLLSHLLHFQVDGQFPVFLHQYPEVHDALIGADLLCVFAQILKRHRLAVGEELADALLNSTQKLAVRGLEEVRRIRSAYAKRVKLAAAASALGFDAPLDELRREFDPSACCQRKILADLCVGLSLLPRDQQWPEVWDLARSLWHPELGRYSGPLFSERFEGREFKASSFELFFGGQAFGRELLWAPLITQTESLPKLGQHTVDGQRQGAWVMNEDCSLSVAAWDEPSDQKGYHPFCYVDSDMAMTCHVKNAQLTSWDLKSDGAFLEFFVPPQEKEMNHPVSFFVERMPLLVNGVRQNTFGKGDEISVGRVRLQLEADSPAFGHVMMGERPSQLLENSEKVYSERNWKIVYRPVRADEPLTLKATVRRL